MKKFLLLPVLFFALSLSFSQNILIVNLPTDKGVEGELRFAINRSKPGDVINIEVENVVLEQGEIAILHDLHITGQEKNPATIIGNGATRIFSFKNLIEPSQPIIKDPATGELLAGSLIEHLVLTGGLSSDPEFGGEGGAVRLNNRSALFRKVTFQKNSTIGKGGAVCAFGGQLIFEYCTFNTNTAENEVISNGGAIYYENREGGQSQTLPSLRLTGSSLSGNQSARGAGGAIYLIDNSDNFTYAVKNSTFYNNAGAGGGAIALSDDKGSSIGNIDQCTFSGNIDTERGGGAIQLINNGKLSITRSTITENTSGGGGGGIYTALGTVSLYSTIVSKNSIGSQSLPFSEDLYAQNEGALTSEGYNFLGINSFNFFGNPNPNDIKGDEPLLTALADNGGLTLTHRPSEKSPVIDAGDVNLKPDGTEYDQRGEPFVRFYENKIIDIGAVEFVPVPIVTCPEFVNIIPPFDLCYDPLQLQANTDNSQDPEITYNWSVLAGTGSLLNPSSQFPTLSGLKPNATVQIQVTINKEGCAPLSDITTITKPDEIAPEITVTAIPPTLCEGTPITFVVTHNLPSSMSYFVNWYFSNPNQQPNLFGDTVLIENYNQGDSIYATINLSTGNQSEVCFNAYSDTSNVEYFNPIPYTYVEALVSSPGSLCEGDTVQLQVQGYEADSFNWYEIDSETDLIRQLQLPADTLSSITIDSKTFTSFGTKIYFVAAANACDTTISNSINVYFQPKNNAGTLPSDTICVGGSVTLQANSSNNSISGNIWQQKSSSSEWVTLVPNIGFDSLTITPNETAEYRLVVRDSDGICPRDTSNHALITVNTPPKKASLPADMTICAGERINLTASGSLDNLDWFVSNDGETFEPITFPNMIGDSIATQVLFENNTNTPRNYYLFVQSTNSCGSVNSDTMVITVNPIPSIDPIASVVECGSYILPPITGTNLSSNQAYFTAPNGQGTVVAVGTEIVSNTILYAYDISTTGCFSESVLTISINTTPSVDIGPNQTICESNSPVQLNGSLGGAATAINWTTNGTGSFSNTNAINPTYTLSPADILQGQITIKATTVSSPSCTDEVDSLLIIIPPQVVVDAGADQASTCSDDSFNLNGSITNATSGTWSNYEGTFSPSATDLSATYTPSQNEIDNGLVQLILTSDNNSLCPSVSDTVDLTIVNYELILSDDVASIFSGDSIVMDVLENDLVEGGVSALSLVNPPTAGTAYINSSNQLVYVSAFGFSGNETVDYTVIDQCGFVDQATLQLTITNTAPTAIDINLSLLNQTSATFDLRTLFTDAENNILFDSTTIVSNNNVGVASISGFDLTVVYSNTNINTIDSFYVNVLDAGNETATALIKILLSGELLVADAGADKTIKTFSTTLNATPVIGATSYWSPVSGLTFDDLTNPTASVSGFNPEKSPYLLIWNVDNGNTISSDTVKITVINVPPVIIKAEKITVKQKITVISLDSLVVDSNRNISSIKIITPFSYLDGEVVSIDNEALTITIDLNKSGISDTTSIVDSLEYEVCDAFNTCDRSYIRVLREGVNMRELTRIEEISPNTIYNFLSPNNDILNSNFFFNIKIIKSDGTELIVDIVTDNETNGILRYGPDFANTFSELVERIEVVIFNRWGDQIIAFEDYFGGVAYTKGEIIGNEVPEEYVWKGRDKNGNSLVNGTYYFYVKIISRVSDDSSTSGFIELRD